jgi:anaerobic glycerol-3-phosphate dehydrogenase
MSLSETRKQITILNLKQTELLNEAIRAVESSLFRAAIVMAWAAFVDFLQEKLASDNLVAVHKSRPNWTKWASLDDLKENVTEFQMIEVAKEVKLLTKTEMKALQGSLSRRNECAHPSGYNPGLNEALGYVSELLNRIPSIGQKTPK